jgi:hypothetical protein
MCPSGVTCLPTHLFSLLVKGEGGLGFFLCLSVVNPILFHTSGRSKILLCIHEVKDTCIRDLHK